MESNKETDVEAPPTYEETQKDEKPSPDEKTPPQAEKPPPEPKKETKLEGNVAPSLGEELESRRPCCCACCCGYQGCTLAIGIVCLVFACLELMLLFIIFGVSAFYGKKNPHWKSSAAVLVLLAILTLLIVIFNIIINILLIVGAKSKNRKLVLVWIYGTIVIVVLVSIKAILGLVGGRIGSFLVDLIWICLLCYFIWVVWMFRKLKCKKPT